MNRAELETEIIQKIHLLSDETLEKVFASFPNSVWECLLRRSASCNIEHYTRHSQRDIGNEKKCAKKPTRFSETPQICLCTIDLLKIDNYAKISTGRA